MSIIRPRRTTSEPIENAMNAVENELRIYKNTLSADAPPTQNADMYGKKNGAAEIIQKIEDIDVPSESLVFKAYEQAAVKIEAVAAELIDALGRIKDHALHEIEEYEKQVMAVIELVNENAKSLRAEGHLMTERINADATRLKAMADGISTSILTNKRDGWK